MPNHTTVKLTIEGPSEQVDKFIEENRGVNDTLETGEPSPLSFETQHPTPSKAVSDTTTRDSSGEFKMPDWYNWRLENWGTKWDCYDHAEWEGLDTAHPHIKFFTAWSPPTAFLLYVSKKYPALWFTQQFADEGGGFLGYEVILNGDVTESVDLKWDSGAGLKLREELGCVYEEEELMGE